MEISSLFGVRSDLALSDGFHQLFMICPNRSWGVKPSIHVSIHQTSQTIRIGSGVSPGSVWSGSLISHHPTHSHRWARGHQRLKGPAMGNRHCPDRKTMAQRQPVPHWVSANNGEVVLGGGLSRTGRGVAGTVTWCTQTWKNTADPTNLGMHPTPLRGSQATDQTKTWHKPATNSKSTESSQIPIQ